MRMLQLYPLSHTCMCICVHYGRLCVSVHGRVDECHPARTSHFMCQRGARGHRDRDGETPDEVGTQFLAAYACSKAAEFGLHLRKERRGMHAADDRAITRDNHYGICLRGMSSISYGLAGSIAGCSLLRRVHIYLIYIIYGGRKTLSACTSELQA